MITASTLLGSSTVPASRASARNARASPAATPCNSLKSAAIARIPCSQTSMTGASPLTLPTPTSGPNLRLPMRRTKALAKASRAQRRIGSLPCSSIASKRTSVRCRGSWLMEFLSNNRLCSIGKQRSGGEGPSLGSNASSANNDGSWQSRRPCWASVLEATAATVSAWRRSAVPSTLQSTLTALAKCAIGWDSTPMLASPSFLHSTKVVPVPQKGSSTVPPAANPKRST